LKFLYIIGGEKSFKVGGQEQRSGGHAPVGPEAKPLVVVWGLHPRLTLFVKNMLFCHSFKNDIAIFTFTVYKYSI